MLLLRCQDAQGKLLASTALPIYHICALVHVDSALWEGCGLQEQNRQSHSEVAERRQHKVASRPEVLGHSCPPPSIVPLPPYPLRKKQGRPGFLRRHQAGFHFLLENNILACTRGRGSGGGGQEGDSSVRTAGGTEAAKILVPEGLLIQENNERKLQRR